MINRIYILILTIFLVGVKGVAQEKLLDKANEKYEAYSFSPAIDIYKKVLDRGYASADLLKKLGNSYYFNADYKEAADTYKRLVDNYPDDTPPDYYFRYAQTLKTLQDYETSKTVMAQFLEATNDDERASAYKSEKDYLKEIKKNSGRFNVAAFQYNSPIPNLPLPFIKRDSFFPRTAI